MPAWLTWAAIRAVGGSALNGAWAGIKRFFSALDAQGWIGLVASVALAWVALHQWGEARHWKKQSGQFEKLYHNEQSAFAKTVADYRAAADKARQADAANKARVEVEQRTINERTSHDYQARIADARAVAQRLREQLTAAANSRSGGGTAVPGLPAPAGGIAQSAANGFSLDDRLVCTEQSIQLDELIKWNRRQADVAVNAKR